MYSSASIGPGVLQAVANIDNYNNKAIVIILPVATTNNNNNNNQTNQEDKQASI
jgi:hypothetical protein